MAHREGSQMAYVARKDFLAIRKRFMTAYWMVVLVSVGLLLVAFGLFAVPVISFVSQTFVLSNIQVFSFLAAGVSALLLLLWFRPEMRIHRLMGDLGQLTLVFESYLTQVNVQLDAMQNGQASPDEACVKVGEITKDCAGLIQNHYSENGRRPVDLSELLKSSGF